MVGSIEEKIVSQFEKMELAAGYGAVMGVSCQLEIIFHGDASGERIDKRMDDGFLLDFRCSGARTVFGTVFVAYRASKESSIVIEQFRGERIFARLNKDMKRPASKARKNLAISGNESSNQGIAFIGQWPAME